MSSTDDFSFPKSARLREEKIFRELLASKQKISTPFFSVKYKSNFLAHARLGVVPPKKKFAASPSATASSGSPGNAFAAGCGPFPPAII